MTNPETSTCSRQSQKRELWTQGCLVASVVGLLMLMGMLVSLCKANCQPPLQVPPQRINPNTASMASLVRLPGIGKARAFDIIHYRQTQGQDESVFQSAHDLEAIRGIGPKTAAKLEPWLVFKTE